MILRPVLQPVLRSVERSPFAGAGLGGSTPLTVFGSRLLYWNDPSDLANTWQDSGRTTGAAVGQPVGSRANKGVLGGFAAQATGSSRPTLRLVSGNYYDESDTVDDFLSIAINLSAYSALTVAVGVVKESDAAAGMAAEYSANVTTNAGAFSVAAPGGASASYGFGLNGTALAAYTPLGFASPQSRVLVDILDIGGATIDAEIMPYIDGVLSQSGGSGANAGTGNFGNYTLYEMMRGGASLPLFGSLYQRLIISGAVSAGERAWLQTWMGSKQGKVI